MKPRLVLFSETGSFFLMALGKLFLISFRPETEIPDQVFPPTDLIRASHWRQIGLVHIKLFILVKRFFSLPHFIFPLGGARRSSFYVA